MTEIRADRPQPVGVNAEKLQSLRVELQAARRDKPTAAVLDQHRNLVARPNMIYPWPFPQEGDIALEEGKAYRNINLNALEDLLQNGIVRNQETANPGSLPTNRTRVFWSTGIFKENEVTYTNVTEVVLVAQLEKVDTSWATIGDLDHIYLKNQQGNVIDLLEGME